MTVRAVVDATPKLDKSVSSFLRQLTTWHYTHLLLSAGREAIDQYLLAAGPTVVNPPRRRVAAEDVTDGQTDRQTNGLTDGRAPDSFLDPVPQIMPAVSKAACDNLTDMLLYGELIVQQPRPTSDIDSHVS